MHTKLKTDQKYNSKTNRNKEINSKHSENENARTRKKPRNKQAGVRHNEWHISSHAEVELNHT